MSATGQLLAVLAGTAGVGLVVNMGRRLGGSSVTRSQPPPLRVAARGSAVERPPRPARPPAVPRPPRPPAQSTAERERSRRYNTMRRGIEARGHRPALLDQDTGEIIELTPPTTGDG